MGNPGKRLNILTPEEIQSLYGLPSFTYEERVAYFSLSPLEKGELQSFRTTRSKVYFIIQLGYFKAKKMFFRFSFEEAKKDIEYIIDQYFPNESCFNSVGFSKVTKSRQQRRILKLLDYSLCTKKITQQLLQKAFNVASVCVKPIYIFKELMTYSENNRIAIPGYSLMQDIVGKALTLEKQRISQYVMRYVAGDSRVALDKLLKEKDWLYELTFIKQEPKDFSYTEITQEANKRRTLKGLYDLAEQFLPKLNISNENINHYASLVGYYTVFRLKRMKREIVYVYLICFIFRRFQKINDNLINTFIYYVSNYVVEAKQVAKEKAYEYKMVGNQHLKEAARVLNLFIDEMIPEEIVFQKVKDIAFGILDKEKFPIVSQYLLKAEFDTKEYEWDYYANLERRFKKNLRYIFLEIDFESPNKEDFLLQAENLLKDTFYKGKSLSQVKPYAFPHEFISEKLTQYLYEPKKVEVNGRNYTFQILNVNKYEFLIYRLIRQRLESGDIFVRDSVNFKSFEEDLVDDETWKKKENLIRSLNLPYLHKPIDEILSSFEKALEIRILEVNNRIKEGKNSHIKFKGKDDKVKWSLPYKGLEEEVNNPIYEQCPQIGIYDLLRFVNEQSNFMLSFTHILGRYVKNEVDERKIYACIVSYGTNIGLYKMGQISDIGFHELITTASNFIRLETLKDANDQVSNAIAKLPIFKYYDIEFGVIHSSSDGQKFETQISTINARHSPKYFGLKSGIVDYSSIANHVPINAKIIGANEHESHYVFDILFNNTSDIKPQKHSTDTHGTNHVNFFVLDVFGYQFAPRYKDLSSRGKNMIYGFKNLSEYESLLIKPIRRIDTQLIKDEWENIQRIMVSLALKATSQSVIIRKLSSYARQNRTKRALWECDNIVKSIYVLNYVDDIFLRRNVQKAMNRVESYHKLKRAVFHDNSGKFRVKTELEQKIWSECARLIANCIIFYNSYILSKLLVHLENMGLYGQADRIKRMSPVAWRHINLYGRYEFNKNDSSVNIDEIVNSVKII